MVRPLEMRAQDNSSRTSSRRADTDASAGEATNQRGRRRAATCFSSIISGGKRREGECRPLYYRQSQGAVELSETKPNGCG